jgi:hypothetical protein
MSIHFKELVRAVARKYFDWGMAFHQTGFHGDLHLVEVVEYLLTRSDAFIETGTSTGSSLAHVARKHPEMRCLSCEPDADTFNRASKNIAGLTNVELFREDSLKFLDRITSDASLAGANPLFWLDAHGYGFDWPLREEVARITRHWPKARILIDDFLVPGLDCFGYDEYRGQVCSFEYIRTSLAPDRSYRLIYPAYTDLTSNYNPLRGWGLIEYGHGGEPDFPETLAGLIHEAAV